MRLGPALRRRATRSTALVVPALLLLGCGGEDSPIRPDPPESTTGTLEVRATTTGDTTDADGYTVSLDGQSERAIEPNGTVTFPDVEAGSHELSMGDVQANCSPDGDDPRTVSVTAGETTTEELHLSCVAALLDRLAFDSKREGNNNVEVYLMRTDGTDLRRITNEPSQDAGPAISPDGSKIAFSSRRSGSYDIWVANVDGSGLTRVTTDPAGDFDPSWSPDGSRLAFWTYRHGAGEIYVIDADGTDLTRVTDDPAQDIRPDWSPDGSRLVFERTSRGFDLRAPARIVAAESHHADSDVYTIAPDGGAATRLTDDGAVDTYPAWSPDGSRIAFQTDRDGSFEIYTMADDGSDLVRVTDDTKDAAHPAWSPDGSRILFDYSYPTGGSDLFTVTPEGEDLLQVTDHGAGDRHGSYGPARR